MSDEILYDVRDHIAYVTLNRPQKLNAITPDQDRELAGLWDQIDADSSIWVAVLSAAGERAFCAGADISGGISANPERLALGGGLTGVGGPLRVLTKPLVAAVQGYALGGGFELAMCADIIIAADNAQFGLPEVKAGIIGDSGVMHRAIRQLPYRVALTMVLTGDRMSADDALRHGLINAVVSSDELQGEAERWARRLTAASPLAQQAAKDALLSRADMPLAQALGTRFELIERYAHSHDVEEGRRAFAEKRPPEWTGR